MHCPLWLIDSMVSSVSILTSNPVITIQHITSVTVMHTTCTFILFGLRCDLRCDKRLAVSICVVDAVIWLTPAPLQLLFIDFVSLGPSISIANGAVGYGECVAGIDIGNAIRSVASFSTVFISRSSSQREIGIFNLKLTNCLFRLAILMIHSQFDVCEQCLLLSSSWFSLKSALCFAHHFYFLLRYFPLKIIWRKKNEKIIFTLVTSAELWFISCLHRNRQWQCVPTVCNLITVNGPISHTRSVARKNFFLFFDVYLAV